MKKNASWARSLLVCLVVMMVMAGAAVPLLSGTEIGAGTSSKVEAAHYFADYYQGPVNPHFTPREKATAPVNRSMPLAEETAPAIRAATGSTDGAKETGNDNREPEQAQAATAAPPVDHKAANNQAAAPEAGSDNREPELSTAVTAGAPTSQKVVEKQKASADTGSDVRETQAPPSVTASAPVDHRAAREQDESSGAGSEEPAAAPITAPVREPAAETVSPAAPVSYSWGAAGSYTFRMEVHLINNGRDTSRNVRVAVPLLENSSPYQTTTLRSTNYPVISSSGRVSTFDLGDLAPGESKTIRADFDVTVRPVSLNSTNETVEKAYEAYRQYAGSGNCRVLARGFINRCREMGITAREVIGFARPQRGPMTSGSLQGCRHSWAEFYVDGLGWVPVDLTFQYFAAFPHPSHIVESYRDESIRVNYSGGNLGATWSNAIR